MLQQEDNLSEIVQLVGKESLSEDQKVRQTAPSNHSLTDARPPSSDPTSLTASRLAAHRLTG